MIDSSFIELDPNDTTYDIIRKMNRNMKTMQFSLQRSQKNFSSINNEERDYDDEFLSLSKNIANLSEKIEVASEKITVIGETVDAKIESFEERLDEIEKKLDKLMEENETTNVP